MAEKVRVSELSETDGVAAEELELLPLLALEDEELLQAAAARHTASDTDATAAPFLATRIIKTTSCLKGKGRRGPHPGMQHFVAGLMEVHGLSVLTMTLERGGLTWP
jgi:hypothetical protein